MEISQVSTHRWWWCIIKRGWTWRCWKILSCCNLKWYLWRFHSYLAPCQKTVLKIRHQGKKWMSVKEERYSTFEPRANKPPFFRSLLAHIDGGFQHKNIIFQKCVLDLITHIYDGKMFVCKPSHKKVIFQQYKMYSSNLCLPGFTRVGNSSKDGLGILRICLVAVPTPWL